jgi:hypothetical protein
VNHYVCIAAIAAFATWCVLDIIVLFSLRKTREMNKITRESLERSKNELAAARQALVELRKALGK